LCGGSRVAERECFSLGFLLGSTISNKTDLNVFKAVLTGWCIDSLGFSADRLLLTLKALNKGIWNALKTLKCRRWVFREAGARWSA